MKKRPEYGLVGRSTVLAPDGAEHTLAAGLTYQLIQDAVVNLLTADQLVVCGLRDLRHAGMSRRLIQDHERCVLEVHAWEFMTVPGRYVRGISQQEVRPDGNRICRRRELQRSTPASTCGSPLPV